MSTPPGDLHDRAVQHWTALVAQVPDDGWSRPTPCTDWDVRALVNHVTGEELWTLPLFRGATIAEVGDRFDGDVLGDDPIATAGAAAQDAAGVVSELLPGGGTVQLSYGEESMAEYAAQLAADHLIHGWDLAAALDLDRTLDAALVESVATWFAEREEAYRSSGAIGPRGQATGDPQRDLLAAFGRDPDWRFSPGS